MCSQKINIDFKKNQIHEISKNLIFVCVWKYVWKYVNINVSDIT